MNSFHKHLASFKKNTRDSRITIVFIVIAIGILATPLQIYVSMSRLQHYGLALFLVGLGYILQVIWSWSSLRTWTRLGQLVSGLFLTSTALVLYANPWLESKMGVRTEAQESLKTIILNTYALLVVPVFILCLLWSREEIRAHRKKRESNHEVVDNLDRAAD